MILPVAVGGAVYFAPQEAQKVSVLCNIRIYVPYGRYFRYKNISCAAKIMKQRKVSEMHLQSLQFNYCRMLK